MKIYPTSKIRNIGIMAHGGAGKTSLTEAILYNSGAIDRLGKVDNGNTTTDYTPEEIERKVTINLSLAPFEWKDSKVNLLDTPGYADFFGDVKSAIRVVDGVVLAVCAVAGVEVSTEIIWDQLEDRNLPRVCFINKMDRENADFYRTLNELKESFDKNIVPLQLPIGKEDSFSGIVDITNMKAYTFKDGKPQETEIPSDLKDDVEAYREQLTEAVAESDDELLMKYLEGEEISPEEFKNGLVNGIKNNNFVPVLCGSAINNIGITPLMDLLVDCMPSPETAEGKSVEEMENEPLSVLVFKTLADPYVGKVSFLRVFGGTLKSNTNLYNTNTEEEEKVSNLFVMRGKKLDQVDELKPGDIGVVTKLGKTTTGDTLSLKADPQTLEGIEFPEPTLSYAIQPKKKGDEDKLGTGISKILDEDKTIKLEKNIETKETVLTCMGELQMDVIAEKLNKRYGVEIKTETPTVPYRETIKAKVQKIEGKHKKQSGGHGQYGHVFIDMEPLYDKEFEFEETIFGGAVPKQYIPAVEKGIIETMEEGVLAGFPVTNIKVTLVDGSYHSVDSSEMAFKVAASIAFKKAMEQAKPVLLEPIMKVQVTVPEQYMGDIMGDLNSKRGKIQGMEPKGKFQVINAMVPLAEMYRYAIDLKSMTQGRGVFTMEFAQYEEVPAHIAEKVIEERKQQKEE
jgi:elongation factor G